MAQRLREIGTPRLLELAASVIVLVVLVNLPLGAAPRVHHPVGHLFGTALPLSVALLVLVVRSAASALSSVYPSASPLESTPRFAEATERLVAGGWRSCSTGGSSAPRS